MTVAKWDPWQEISALQNRINRIFDESFYRPDQGEREMGLSRWNPPVDIYEDGDAIFFKAELPGIDKNDIVIDFKDRILTLKGERRMDKAIQEDNYFRRERFFGRFQRSFSLPALVDSEKIRADFKDGVLTITVPKPEPEKQKKIEIL